MNQNDYLQEVYGISCYSCCYTCLNFQHEQQQEIIKEHLTLLGTQNLK